MGYEIRSNVNLPEEICFVCLTWLGLRGANPSHEMTFARPYYVLVMQGYATGPMAAVSS